MAEEPYKADQNGFQAPGRMVYIRSYWKYKVGLRNLGSVVNWQVAEAEDHADKRVRSLKSLM